MTRRPRRPGRGRHRGKGPRARRQRLAAEGEINPHPKRRRGPGRRRRGPGRRPRVALRQPGHAPEAMFPNRKLFARQAYGLEPLTLELDEAVEAEEDDE